MAVVHTRQTAEEVRATLRSWNERRADCLLKQLEVIMDADLLQFNDRVLKPADMQRSYVQRLAWRSDNEQLKQGR
ncbi:MAG: hypothetical protein R2738_06695 [Bacteroides graminisolvens]